MTKLIVGITTGLAIALFAGWAWGQSGRAETARALESAELRGELLASRAAVLDARMAIYGVDFGEASKHLEDARVVLRLAGARLKRLGRDDEAKHVDAALASIDDAQSLALKLDQNANSRAGEAARTLADLIDAHARR